MDKCERQLAADQLTGTKRISMQPKPSKTRCKTERLHHDRVLIATVRVRGGSRGGGAARAAFDPFEWSQSQTIPPLWCSPSVNWMRWSISPLPQRLFSDPQGVLCPPATLCNLGTAATPKVPVVGSRIVEAIVRNSRRPRSRSSRHAAVNITTGLPNRHFGVAAVPRLQRVAGGREPLEGR